MTIKSSKHVSEYSSKYWTHDISRIIQLWEPLLSVAIWTKLFSSFVPTLVKISPSFNATQYFFEYILKIYSTN